MGGLEVLCKKLFTDSEVGIDFSSIPIRNSHFSTNHPMIRKMPSFFSFVIECFEDLTLKILTVSALVSLVVGTIQDPREGWYEGLAIIVTISIVVMVASLNNYLKEKKFQKLNEESQERYCTVIRESKESHISVFELVVGDIIKITSGDVMPIDGVILWSMNLEVDESTVTGESDLVKKNPDENRFLLSGSQIADGNGVVLVLAVGKYTFLGKNREKILNVQETDTPLQSKLNYIAEVIGKVGLTAAVLTLIVLLLYVIIDIIKNGWEMHYLKRIIDSFIVAIAIVVVAVPEGLPLAVTLSLAYAVNQMKKQNNLVRHLDASETMGQATCICTDKTGTLTENVMKVVAIYSQNQNLAEFSDKNFHPTVKDLLLQQFCQNTTADFNITNGKETFTGNRTEIALIKLAKD